MAVRLLRLPQPYDFDLSTERYRVFGADRANLWHEGGLHRVVNGREVRIEAAPGGVRVEPLDAETEPVVRKLLGDRVRPRRVRLVRAGQSGARARRPRARGLPPAAVARPVRDPRHVDHRAAGVAAGGVRDPQPPDRAVWGAGAVSHTPSPRASGSRWPSRRSCASSASHSGRPSTSSPLARSDLCLDALGDLPDEEVSERLTALPGIGEWTADWFLARHLARPRAWPAGDLALRKAVGAFCDGGRSLTIAETRALAARFAPFENLSAHYLLTGVRMGLA